MARVFIQVVINGTDTNPYKQWGLKHNPFPQLAKVEYNAAEMQINSLGGEPVKSANDIRQRLRGFSEEFIELCVRAWEPGEMVMFSVNWDVKA